MQVCYEFMCNIFRDNNKDIISDLAVNRMSLIFSLTRINELQLATKSGRVTDRRNVLRNLMSLIDVSNNCIVMYIQSRK